MVATIATVARAPCPVCPVADSCHRCQGSLPDIARWHRQSTDSTADHQHRHLDSGIIEKVAKIGRNDPCPCGSGKKYKKCCLQLPPKPLNVDLKAFRSELIVVTLKTASTKRKVLQIFFGRDNSVYVNFPYFKHREGILASATMPAKVLHPQQINLAVSGKVASHLVKYSHHPDGRAHFSQHGRVRSEIRRQSVALDTQDGHMFTATLQGLEAFDEAEAENPTPTPKRTTITFEVTNATEPSAFKIIGRWQDISNIKYSNIDGQSAGPILGVVKSDGTRQVAFVLANPREVTHHILILTCEPIPALTTEPAKLIFVGAFDAKEIVDDLTRDTGFLAFIYPAEDIDTLRETIGSIDYHPST